eukprot:CAMPEP_0180569516 /NCGR_PEP_ID=MMETSP1037_2-20121125/7720_1 /TAXON_ID=632150 /ORGANISM="Azadinium spinosum, Strain 3D9" /LENGTH=73 /DNA_ID=CAMNT_0022586757 /DNA_START=274 /DNA_END=495 /DNA_ORIENTATION=+
MIVRKGEEGIWNARFIGMIAMSKSRKYVPANAPLRAGVDDEAFGEAPKQPSSDATDIEQGRKPDGAASGRARV